MTHVFRVPAQELQEKGADEAAMANAFASYLAGTLRPLDEELEAAGGGFTWLLEDRRQPRFKAFKGL